MIKIKSFVPTNNFSRIYWEFFDDYMIAKMKSLTIEYERDIRYEKINSIQSKRMVELDWIRATAFTLILLEIVSLGLGWLDISIPIIIKKTLAVCALLMLFPVFLRYEYYSFYDADNNFLASIKVNRKTKQLLLDAIKLIKQKTNITSEIYFDDALPSNKPNFQFSNFDFADFLNRETIMIYDDQIINIEKSLVEEITTITKFSGLSGKTKFAKLGNNNWDTFSSYWLFTVCITIIIMAIFFSEQVKGNDLAFSLSIGSLALTLPLSLLSFIKGDILVFYDKQDNSIFWTRVNRRNRDKLNNIVEFIKDREESQK